MYPECFLGFQRLAINGNEPMPIEMDGIALICNGEIYNYPQLYQVLNLDGVPVRKFSESDCEIIVHLYKRFGIEHTLHLLDGVFAFVLVDKEAGLMFVARDPFGVRPLFCLKQTYTKTKHHVQKTKPGGITAFASEIKALMYLHDKDTTVLSPFVPGTCSMYSLNEGRWIKQYEHQAYHKLPFCSLLGKEVTETETSFYETLNQVQSLLIEAVRKRCDPASNTNCRPVACMLSGGLDSSLIAALLKESLPRDQILETYSVGLAGSPDLMYAQQMADHLGSKHTSLVLSEADFVAVLPDVIWAIESYDTTTVRASIGNYLVGKYIKSHSDAKIVFNGDGSDELTGGYLYFHRCPDDLEFDRECRRLLKNIHLFDVLRSDRCMAAHGLESRTPFLDRAFTQYYLSIPPSLRRSKKKNMGKWLLRRAFEGYYNKTGSLLLPPSILWRRKEAFSDGVTGTSRSLYQILQEHCNCLSLQDEEDHPDQDQDQKRVRETETNEQKYYKRLFQAYFPEAGHTIVPFYWMPRYVDATDASARTLALYNDDDDDVVKSSTFKLIVPSEDVASEDLSKYVPLSESLSERQREPEPLSEREPSEPLSERQRESEKEPLSEPFSERQREPYKAIVCVIQ